MKFKFNNFSLPIGRRKNYQWFKCKVFMDEPDEKLIKAKATEYRLPETFPNPIRVIENQKSQFALNLSTGENFCIYITIYLEDGNEEYMEYYLDLQKTSFYKSLSWKRVE